jgi:hypothetical protein
MHLKKSASACRKTHEIGTSWQSCQLHSRYSTLHGIGSNPLISPCPPYPFHPSSSLHDLGGCTWLLGVPRP